MSARESELSVIQGDCIEAMAAMPAASVDAIVTDPPYGLEFMGKDWDGADGFRRSLNGADVGRDDPFGRSSRTSSEYRAGKLFQAWCEQWAREALRVLRPGGHLLALGGTRTAHRLVCAIEDAGFEIRDTIAWLYGSGFPKSLDVARGVRGDLAERWFRAPYGTPLADMLWLALDDAVPVVEEAAGKVEGHGTALKPAHEPIVVARKPLTGTVAACVLAHGTGALNVDGCRIGTEHITAHGGGQNEQRTYGMGKGIPAIEAGANPHVGRWPANVCLDERGAAMLDAQTGILQSGSRAEGVRTGLGYHGANGDGGPAINGDSGGASRFLYVAKASSAERNAGLDGFEEQSVHPPSGDGRVWDIPGSKSTHCRNHHPTVKPIALMRWLVRLVTPPGGTVLDPFAGSGTTGIAAVLEGFDFLGMEREAEYVAIAQARIAWWSRHPDGMTLVKRLEAEAERAATAAAGQGSLFDVPHAPSTSSNGRDGEASAERQYADRGASNFAMKPGRRR